MVYFTSYKSRLKVLIFNFITDLEKSGIRPTEKQKKVNRREK